MGIHIPKNWEIDRDIEQRRINEAKQPLEIENARLKDELANAKAEISRLQRLLQICER